MLESLRGSSPLTAVSAVHLAGALDDLLDSSQHITRALLGVGVDPTTLPPGGGTGGPGRQPGMQGMPMRGHARAGGWFAFGNGS